MQDIPRPEWCAADLWARELERLSRHRWLQLFEREPRTYFSSIPPYNERVDVGARVIGWRGRVRPFPTEMPPDETWRLIADLDAPSQPRIGVYKNGALGHLDGCGVDHAALRADLRDALTPLPALDAEYEVEIVYRRPPAYPLVRAVDPPITVREYPDMPHPMKEIDALCVVFPPEVGWTFEHVGAAMFADDAVLYLARHTIWLYLRGRLTKPWIGVDASHRPRDLLKIPSTAHCQCGSGKLFGSCHRDAILAKDRHEREALQRAIATSDEAWLQAQQLAEHVRRARPPAWPTFWRSHDER